MSTLEILPADLSSAAATFTDPDAIARALDAVGVGFERWQASAPLTPDASSEQILAAYADPIARLSARHGFQSVDVVRMHPEHPARAEARRKFLAEHTHADFEVRFFVEGRGRFYLHIGDQVFLMTCEAGDLLSVPSGTRHWFDMGERPLFTAIRLFTTPEGWVASFTGDDIATHFPELAT